MRVRAVACVACLKQKESFDDHGVRGVDRRGAQGSRRRTGRSTPRAAGRTDRRQGARSGRLRRPDQARGPDRRGDRPCVMGLRRWWRQRRRAGDEIWFRIARRRWCRRGPRRLPRDRPCGRHIQADFRTLLEPSVPARRGYRRGHRPSRYCPPAPRLITWRVISATGTTTGNHGGHTVGS